MRRAEGLVELSRRGFCGGVAGCIGLATVAGCVDGGSGVIQTGPLGGPEGAGPDSGTHMPPPDGSHMPPPDAPMNVGTCPSSGVTDVGAPSSFTTNNPKYFSSGNFFVVRDSGGLYALTARCTHEGATCVVSQGEFYCPRHGAEFDFNGGVIAGPVFQPLVHYSMCTLSNGHVGVVKSQTVSASTRLNA